MRLKCDFEAVDMGDEIINVPIGKCAQDYHGVIKTNESAQQIMELLKEEITEDQIVNTLAAQYENTREDLNRYVRETINALRNVSLIED